MTDTLFDLPDSPSPRLQWMRRHGVVVEHRDEGEGCFIWVAKYTNDPLPPSLQSLYHGYGETEDEALTDFAIRKNLKLWNEE